MTISTAQGGFLVAQGIQFKLVIFHEIPQLLDIEGSQPGTAGNEDGFQSLARRHFEFLILLHRKVFRLPFFQVSKENINGALVVLVVLPGLTGIDKIQQHYEILFFLRGLVPDVADQSAVVKAFCLDPKIFAGFFALALGIHNQGIDQLQDIFL